MQRNKRESGFGLLESLVGLLVFVILSMVGTKAFHAIVANHKESAQMKALTDAVMETAEKLSGLTIPALTAPSAGYTAWSAPQAVALGTYVYRYRIVPNPAVAGATDTTVVGLQVETGTMVKGAFVAVRSFATLIAPHLNSKNGKGEVSTLKERDAEAVFHAALVSQLDALSKEVVGENQVRLNSFSCYDKGQCCGFMKEFFLDPNIRPTDGLKEKCLYRCALGGAVPMEDWKKACGFDMCTLAPWKTKEQCCAAIAADDCKPGSVCANVCVSCVGEDGSTCGPPICDGGIWNDFIDCPNNIMCDGSPIPSGNISGWGNVQDLCKTNACKNIGSECYQRPSTCCQAYWGPINLGLQPDPKTEICATISKPTECCNLEVKAGDWNLYCGNDGTVISAQNVNDGQWYCGLNGPKWDMYCAYQKGCSTTYRPAGAPNAGCQPWTGVPLADPYTDTKTGKAFVPPAGNPVVVTPPSSGGVTGGGSGTPPTIIPGGTVPSRGPSKRHGGKYGSGGGQE